MASQEINNYIREIMREELQRVTIVVNKEWRGVWIRLQIAMLLVKLAVWIAGMSYEEDQNVISLKKAKIE